MLTSKVMFLFIHLSYTQFNKSHRISIYKANHDFISFYWSSVCTSACCIVLLVLTCAIKPGNLH